MSEVLNPADIEANIQSIARRIHDGVKVVTDAEDKFKKLNHAHDVAYAHAHMDHQGPAHEKRHAATLATQDERAAAETAEVAFKYAERTAKALDAELRAMQSVGASVRAMYQGERGFGG